VQTIRRKRNELTVVGEANAEIASIGRRVGPRITSDRSGSLFGMRAKRQQIAGRLVTEFFQAQVWPRPAEPVGRRRITPAIKIAFETIGDIPQSELPRLRIVQHATAEHIWPGALPCFALFQDWVRRVLGRRKKLLAQVGRTGNRVIAKQKHTFIRPRGKLLRSLDGGCVQKDDGRQPK
jgi:hypothetical protein